MIKLTFCARRLPHLTREQFQDYWLNKHGPLVCKHADLLNIRRYVQQHTLAHPINEQIQASRKSPEPFDGVAEIWFDSVEAFTAPGNSKEGRAAMREVRADEANFIDSARSTVLVGEEHELVPG